jgi:uncharacterized membrane protein
VWYLQRVLSGVVTAIGYVVGVAGSSVIKKAIRREPGPRVKKVAWIGLTVGATASTIYQLWLSAVWQQDMRRLLGLAPDESSVIAVTMGVLAIAGIVALLIVLLVKLILMGLGGLYRFVSQHKLLKRVPRVVTGLIAASLTTIVLLGIVCSSLVGRLSRTLRPSMTVPVSSSRSEPTSGSRHPPIRSSRSSWR